MQEGRQSNCSYCYSGSTQPSLAQPVCQCVHRIVQPLLTAKWISKKNNIHPFQPEGQGKTIYCTEKKFSNLQILVFLNQIKENNKVNSSLRMSRFKPVLFWLNLSNTKYPWEYKCFSTACIFIWDERRKRVNNARVGTSKYGAPCFRLWSTGLHLLLKWK